MEKRNIHFYLSGKVFDISEILWYKEGPFSGYRIIIKLQTDTHVANYKIELRESLKVLTRVKEKYKRKDKVKLGIEVFPCDNNRAMWTILKCKSLEKLD